jgi:hypothetical protein
MAKDKQKLDEDYIASIVKKELSAANTWMDSGLADEQEDNLDYYYGSKFGNEEEGFSQVVTRDVLETVEGILPELMKIFASGDAVVEFDAVGPADEEQVEIEGQYINHIFMNRGNGYKVLYDWFKDALLMKNGIIKVDWDSSDQVQFREFSMLSEEEYTILKDGESDDEMFIGAQYEIESFSEYEIEGVKYWDCRVKIERKKGRPVITPVPSEEFRIRERSTCLQSSQFVAHVTSKTEGELLSEGFSEDDIEGAQTSAYLSTSGVENARFSNPDESDWPLSTGSSERELEVVESWARIYDSEENEVKLIRSIVIGNKCVEWEEVDRIPLISLSPIMMPHKFTGVAVADLVRDVQEIRSTVFRQMLDNLALQNSGRYTAVEGQVNLQDLIDNRIGGIVRQKMPGAVGRLDTPDLSQFTIPVLEQLDLIKENRTGVSRMTAGLDQSALSSHQTATAVNQVMTAAQGKILLIARNFAETGVKELFIEMYNLIREHQTTPDLVPISGRYAIVNPREWIERYDVHVNVGIGNGNKDQQLFHLSQISQLLQTIGASPYGYLIKPENVFHLASEFIKNSGYQNPTKFISNPATVEPPEPAPDPNLIMAQAADRDSQTNAMKKKADAEKDKATLQLEGRKFEWSKKVDAAEVLLEDTQERPVGIQTGK